MAFLFGFGFLAFGVGVGGGGGGVFNFLTENKGSNSASFASQISKQKSILKKNPQDISAWEKLIKAQLHEAGAEIYVSTTGVTSKGKELFAQIAGSWNSYLALNPSKPSLEIAKQMVSVFDEEGLNEPAPEVAALQIIVAAEPKNGTYYAALAEYAYKAKNTRIGDLASEKAISLSPASQRKKLKEELEAVKANPTGTSSATSTAAGEAASSSNTVSVAGNTTSTTNGPTYKVKVGSKGKKTVTRVPSSTSTSQKK